MSMLLRAAGRKEIFGVFVPYIQAFNKDTAAKGGPCLVAYFLFTPVHAAAALQILGCYDIRINNDGLATDSEPVTDHKIYG